LLTGRNVVRRLVFELVRRPICVTSNFAFSARSWRSAQKKLKKSMSSWRRCRPVRTKCSEREKRVFDRRRSQEDLAGLSNQMRASPRRESGDKEGKLIQSQNTNRTTVARVVAKIDKMRERIMRTSLARNSKA